MGAMSWDWVISITIIVGLILTVWAKVTKQSIPDMIRGFKEIAQESGERGEEFMPVYD